MGNEMKTRKLGSRPDGKQIAAFVEMIYNKNNNTTQGHFFNIYNVIVYQINCVPGLNRFGLLNGVCIYTFFLSYMGFPLLLWLAPK